MVNQLCVLPFLEFELVLEEPKTPNLLYLDHPGGTRGNAGDMTDLLVKNTQHSLYKLYAKENNYNLLFMADDEEDILKVRDFGYDFDREDPIAAMYLANFDDANAETLKPSGEELVELTAIVKRPNFSLLTPEEKDTGHSGVTDNAYATCDCQYVIGAVRRK